MSNDISKFNIKKILEDVIGYRGIPFPGFFLAIEPPYVGYAGEEYNPSVEKKAQKRKANANKGSTLYKKDIYGNYYFMPIMFTHQGKEYEIDNALVSITCKKSIVETSLVGQKGSVKELISMDDYQISITGAIVGYNLEWPEDKIDAIRELFAIDESVELKCALTDIFFEDNDKVVITDLNLPPIAQTEHVQIIEIKCVTDKPFELTIE